MAIERIVIEVTGDPTKLNSTIAELEKIGKVDVKNRESFEKTAAAHKKAMSETHGMADRLNEQFKELGQQIVMAFAVDRVIEFGKESVEAFMEAEENAHRLAFALKSIAGEGDAMVSKLMEQSEKMQKNSIFSDDSIQQAQTALATYGLTGDQIEKLIPQIADLASASGTDLASATDKVIMGLNGQTRGLKEVGIQFKDTGSKTENLALLTQKLTKFEGASAEALETSAGKVARLKNAYDDFKEDVGKWLVSGANDLLDFWELLTSKTSEAEMITKKFGEFYKKQGQEIAETTIKAIEAQHKDDAGRKYATDQMIISYSNEIKLATQKIQMQKNMSAEERLATQQAINGYNDMIVALGKYRESIGQEKKITDDATQGLKDHVAAMRDLTSEIIALENEVYGNASNRRKERLKNDAEDQKRYADQTIADETELANAKLKIDQDLVDQTAAIDKDGLTKLAHQREEAIRKDIKAGKVSKEQGNYLIQDIEKKLQEDLISIDAKAQQDKLDLSRKYFDELDKQTQEELDAQIKMQEEADKKAKEAKEKALKDQADLQKKIIANFFEFVIDIVQKTEAAIEANIAAIDTMQQRESQMIDYQKTLAERGLANDLAFEERRADELEKKKLDEQRKLKRAKELETFLNSVAKFAEDNPSTAVAKALGVLAATKVAEVVFAEEGALLGESTNRKVRAGSLRHRSGKDILVQAEHGERILSVEQNRKFEALGGMGLLKRPIFERPIPDTFSRSYNSNIDVIKELQELKSVVKSKTEYQVNWEQVDGRFERIEKVIQNGVTTTTRHSRFGN